MHVLGVLVWEHAGGIGGEHDRRAHTLGQLAHGVSRSAGPAARLDDDPSCVPDAPCRFVVDGWVAWHRRGYGETFRKCFDVEIGYDSRLNVDGQAEIVRARETGLMDRLRPTAHGIAQCFRRVQHIGAPEDVSQSTELALARTDDLLHVVA